jgi:hypothetical protein
MKAVYALLIMLFALQGCVLVDLSKSAVDSSKVLVGLGPNEVEVVGIMAMLGDSRHATVIEIAFAYGDAAMAVVVSSDASLWFNERQGFCQSYANQLDVIRVELPMGYSALLSELPDGHKGAQAIFVFVEAMGKADLTEFKTPWIILSDSALSVLEAPPGADSSQKPVVASTGVIKLC